MEISTKKMVTAALMTAFTCIATMIIKIPTPTMGYIHLGDGLVLLCGIVLGPASGALAAGIGSMFSDIFSGYAAWAPATFIIKALTAAVCGILFHKLLPRHFRLPFSASSKNAENKESAGARSVCVIVSGLIGETFMVLGYFLYEAGLAAFGSGKFSTAALASGLVSSATGVPFNILQGLAGIVISLLLLPILLNIPDISRWILDKTAPSNPN